ncbi:hypothetical protein HOF46_02695 [Candidatus Woesearchaeota archaeon]|jgi:hypothetical protein|nr:hypothetical protein [Candidatus Woesearchaeota archaeon]MBT4114214.1 hypothetical protein [Candidatus Woesearchaeota archaeon]
MTKTNKVFNLALKKCKSKNFANYEDYEQCLIDEVGEDRVEAVLLYDQIKR